MNTRSASIKLGCSQSTVARRCRDGTLPAERVGGRWSVDLHCAGVEVVVYFDGQHVASAEVGERVVASGDEGTRQLALELAQIIWAQKEQSK